MRLGYSLLYGQTRMQMEQSVPWLTQKPKHFSALVVHLRTPRILEILNVWSVGGPPGMALGGQDCSQRRQTSQNSRTPKRIGLSCASGISVKTLPSRTRGPNSLVM